MPENLARVFCGVKREWTEMFQPEEGRASRMRSAAQNSGVILCDLANKPILTSLSIGFPVSCPCKQRPKGSVEETNADQASKTADHQNQGNGRGQQKKQ
ncbi:MAG: hypothetical protein R2856_07090 [Caldilineaceae bacterium]